jgi:hypothetical protein
MLLELLDHHHELLIAAIEPLICARNCRSLYALAASCRRLRAFLAAEFPILAHMQHFKRVVADINAIDKIICVDNEQNYSTIMNINDRIICYVQFAGDAALTVCVDDTVDTKGRSISLGNTGLLGLMYLNDYEMGEIDCSNIVGPIKKYLTRASNLYNYVERILDIKMGF